MTSNELHGFKELLQLEEMMIQKYKHYAQNCKEPALRGRCESIAQQHMQHYDMLLNEMQ